MYQQDTIVAPATPPGTGAVAIIRLSGPRAGEIARALWRPLGLQSPEPRRLCLGDIRDPESGAPIDRAMAVFIPGPKNLTGEEIAELHCHGGPFIVRRVLGLAISQGARLAQAGEFSRRAFLNGRIDLTAAEAIADLVAAKSENALALALAQLNGRLKERISGLRGQLIGVRAHLEADIDFGEEDIDLPGRRVIAGEIESLEVDVRALHDSFARGRLSRGGARAAIIGRPNVGKSSVLNVLLGVERSIVTPIAGTTRDVIEDTLSLPPYAVVLLDTAGLRHSGDQVERIGVSRAMESVREADLVIAIFDGSRPLVDEDQRVIELCRDKPGVAVLNKHDLPSAVRVPDLRARGLDYRVLQLSALRDEGTEELRNSLRRMVEEMGGGGDQTAISRERHRRALAHALAALAAAREGIIAALPAEIVTVDLAAAADALGEISGEVSSEDVLDAIFREFCIGK